MAFSRRLFLQGGILTATSWVTTSLRALGGRPVEGNEVHAGPALKPPSSTGANWQDHAAALQNIHRESFASAVGTIFKVFKTSSAVPVWITLLAVEDLPKTAPINAGSFAVAPKSSSAAPTSTGFVLLFGGSTPLEQETYLFQHDVLGNFALLTVPQGNNSQVHAAIVNRLDGEMIVAVPFGRGNIQQVVASPAGGITILPATSSGSENLSPVRAGSPGVQRGVTRD